ncbi:disease resistance protein RPM1-like protein [Cinnamomum micranthum f. kanehirae]|uniref:Disease resistance protein RPM1-like protein n=1 Tax=Cinnamomum micranthum f. kanehirae TaxID=337451 RepID=A0A3S3N7X7_9MAGN|nr:disease resistance protein RPM1-like protein [Cinnamomum micranthum f. kanehirae]
MAKNKVRFIKPGSMGQPVSDYEKQRREKIELNNLRLVERGFQRMANSLVDLKEKRKTKTTKEAKNMRAMDDDDEEYQPREDENNFSCDDHLSSYSDEEELNGKRKKNVVAQHTSTPHTEMPHMQPTVPPSSTQGSMPTPTSMVGIPGSLTTESTVAPTPTQDLLVEQRTLSTTPTSLPHDMVRASTSKRVRGATRGINTERFIAASSGTKLVVAVPMEVGAPVGENATRLANWLGVQIRMAAPLKDMEKWDDIPSAIKAPIIQATRVQLEARHREDESRRKEDEALGLPVTMPQEEMPMEVFGKKFYVKEYGVGLKRPSSKLSSAKSHDEVRVLKNQVETLKDMCHEQKNQFETLKDLCHTQQETIRAYDEKFARFDAVMSAYMQGGVVGEGSNSREGKEFLLILDDIWSLDAWEGVKHALPRKGRGIIIFTTRNENVAYPVDEKCFKHELKPLLSEVAWDLFCRKAFRNNYPPGSCPPVLIDVAKAMVERCKGLPLAIVAIGGLMSNKRSTLPSEWDDVRQNLDWESNHNPGLARLNKVLLTSYYYLPSHLKYCFLYCGLFPEDYSIKRKKLIRLWIAEGFIKEYPRKTLEEVAGEYVVQLIQRSMLQPVVDPGTLQIKACKMHDLVRDMAIYLFKEEDFGVVLTNQNEIVTARHLAIQTNEMTTPNTGELNPRSLLMFIEQEFTASSFRPCLVNLRLLRVLDLESCKIESLPDEVGGLIHLRYLSIKQSTVQILPPSLGRLCNLQTLDIRGTFVKSLPVGAMLLRLRHLLLNTNPIVLGSIKMSSLAQLQTLYCVRPYEMLVEQLGYLTQMRKLSIIRVNGAYWTQLLASISKMQHLRSLRLGADSDDEQLQLETFSPPLYLEKLRLHGRMKNLPRWLRSLDCLCELILFGTHLEDDPFRFLKRLPNLAKVMLMNDAYTGERLCLRPEGFPKLMYLGLVDMNELENFKIYGPRRLRQHLGNYRDSHGSKVQLEQVQSNWQLHNPGSAQPRHLKPISICAKRKNSG